MNPTFFLDNTLSVRSINRHVCDLLGQTEDGLLGRRLFDVLRGSDANIASFREFRETVESALLGLCSPCVERDVEVAGIGGARTMHACLMAVNGAGTVQWEPSLPDGIALFTLTLRDLSDGLRARRRVEEERARVRALLSVNLPPCVRDRREGGDSSIAYSIPGASFLCVSLEGVQERRDAIPVLHGLFAEFDAAIAKQSEMTTIRTTGAVYLAIAGAFTEGGQAQANALQAVTAALECVEMVADWNRREARKDADRIIARAAIEVGEKMIAGVLELNVPTFQILGAPFVEVERMAEVGTPYLLLITQKVYELVVYAAQFSIREGPVVKIGTENLRTYIVRPQDE
jgi:hypothetical protein